MNNMRAGASWYPDHWPRDEWERDLRLMKQSGLDCIRFGEFSWSWYEKDEGRFDFSDFDAFMDLAHNCGLGVVLCTPTAAAPEWFLHKYPAARMLNADGHPHSGGRHTVSLRDPDFLRLARRAIETLAARYKAHPALLGWQVDNEPCMGETLDDREIFDYNPASISAFQSWLRQRYQTLDRLNTSWHSSFWSHTYTAWEQITPPRRPGNPAHWLAWMRFRRNEVTGFIKWQRDLLREIRADFVIGTNMPECGALESAFLAQDFWAQAEGLDYVGADIYCYDRDAYEVEQRIGYSCDLIDSAAHSAGAEFWISETQGGPHFSPWAKRFYDGAWDESFLRESLNAYAVHGVERVMFFLWRTVPGGHEFGMNGVVGVDGAKNSRAQALPALLEVARNCTPPQKPSAYLYYSADSLGLAAGFDRDNDAGDTMHGWYRLLRDSGYSVTFCGDAELCGHAWRHDDLLVLPHCMLLDETIAAALEHAKAAGATIVAGYGVGFFDADGNLWPRIPGAGLDSLFGLEVIATDYFATDDQPLLDGAGNTRIGKHLCLADAKNAETVAVSPCGKPLVMRSGRSVFCLFDLGAVYLRCEDRSVVTGWWKGLLGS